MIFNVSLAAAQHLAVLGSVKDDQDLVRSGEDFPRESCVMPSAFFPLWDISLSAPLEAAKF